MKALHADYQQLKTIPIQILEARVRLLRKLDIIFEMAGDDRARECARQGIDWGDMWQPRDIRDPEMKRIVRAWLHYHRERLLMEMDVRRIAREYRKGVR